LIEIINKQLLLQLVGYLCYWQMGFNSVFKGLMFLTRQGRVVSRQTLTADTRVQPQASLSGIYVHKMAMGAGFCPNNCCQ